MTMITPSYLGETIEYSSLHACRSTLEDPSRCHTNGCRTDRCRAAADPQRKSRGRLLWPERRGEAHSATRSQRRRAAAAKGRTRFAQHAEPAQADAAAQVGQIVCWPNNLPPPTPAARIYVRTCASGKNRSTAAAVSFRRPAQEKCARNLAATAVCVGSKPGAGHRCDLSVQAVFAL